MVGFWGSFHFRALLCALSVCISACRPQGGTQSESPEKLKPIEYATAEVERSTLDLEITHFCPNEKDPSGPALVLENFFVRNLSAVITKDNILPDSDRDGVADRLEVGAIGEEYNISPIAPDSTNGGEGDGFGDLSVLRGGFNRKGQSRLAQKTCGADACFAKGDCIRSCDKEQAYFQKFKGPYSTDRLNYCEKELVLGIDPKKDDNSGLGINDYFKVLSAVNPTDPAELYLKTSGDEQTNLQKIQLGLPIRQSANDFIRKYTPVYSVEQEVRSKVSEASCPKPYHLRASNIALGPTADDNLILVNIGYREESSGQRKSLTCCSLVEGKKPGRRSRSVDWHAADQVDWALDGRECAQDLHFEKMVCPCPNSLKEIPGRVGAG